MSKQSTWHKTIARVLLVLAFLIAMGMVSDLQQHGLSPPGPERHADLFMLIGVPLLLVVGAEVLFRKGRRKPLAWPRAATMFGPVQYLIMFAVVGFWAAVIWGIVWAVRKLGK